MTKKQGLSGGHRISYGRPSLVNRTKRIPINKTGTQLRQAREEQKRRIAGAFTIPFFSFISLKFSRSPQLCPT